MKVDQLRINQLSDEAFDWYQQYLEAVDKRDIVAYSDFLSDGCVLTMNNEAPLEGKGAIIDSLGKYWQSFASLEHELLNIYGTDSNFVLEALNRYQRHDGVRVVLRAVAFTDRDASGLVSSARIYTDAGPLFS